MGKEQAFLEMLVHLVENPKCGGSAVLLVEPNHFYKATSSIMMDDVRPIAESMGITVEEMSYDSIADRINVVRSFSYKGVRFESYHED